MKIEFKDKKFLILIILAVVFFVVYSAFFCSTQSKLSDLNNGQMSFSWPDAMANHFFINSFIENSKLTFVEPLNQVFGHIVHPRSVNINLNGELTPVGFLGFAFVYGLIGKLIGLNLVNFLTPLFGVLGVLVFYKIIKQIFNQNTGFISAILLFTLAPYWYYSSLVMLPNIFFVFLIFNLVFCLIRALKTNKNIYYSLAGLFTGLAIITRTSEFIFVLIIVVVILIAYRKKIKFSNFLNFFVIVSCLGAIELFLNYQTYGHAFYFGYYNLSSGSETLFERMPTEFKVNSSSKFLSSLKMLFLPFGFYETRILNNLYLYFIKFIQPYFILFIVGLTYIWIKGIKKLTKEQKVLAIITILLSFWLIIYYGSWQFVDKLVLTQNTIGSSYIRYWLFLYILILPWLGFLFNKVLELKHKLKFLNYILVVMILLGLTGFSVNQVYFTKGDGLIAQKKVITGYYETFNKVKQIVDPSSLLITDRTDKLFFPTFKVIDFNLNYSIFEALSSEIDNYNVYYISNLPEKDMNYINEKKISLLNLKFELIKAIDNENKLYELVKTN